ncbi:CopM family metallochaperone [Bosea sp. NPDC055332]
MIATRNLFAGTALFSVLILAGLALAQGHQGHGSHGATAPAADTAATQAYKEANDRMHKEMGIAFSGDADVDFARGMIPHHQGAVDMAKVVLAHGKDPELRKLAEGVITEQEKEIAFLRDWLTKRGK